MYGLIKTRIHLITNIFQFAERTKTKNGRCVMKPDFAQRNNNSEFLF